MLAPEILMMLKSQDVEEFDEKKADIWALGVTLFQSLFLRLPFEGKYASYSDPWFNLIFEGRFKEFWSIPEVAKIWRFLESQEGCKRPELENLLEGMLEVDPLKRFSVADVVNHPWF